MTGRRESGKSVTARGVRRLVLTLILFAALLLVPAWSWRYWEGWVYFGLMALCWTYFFFALLKHDPQLLERRMQIKESATEQRLLQKLMQLIFFSGLVLAGLDFRFGWSESGVRPVPRWLMLAGQALAVGAYWLVFWVMKTNSFAASTIRVEDGQPVIDRGPYTWVRHPMYFGMILMMLATPLALGSYVALPVFALIVPVLVSRLSHEEKFLRQALPGYGEYCQRTRFRLVPFLW